MTWEHLKAIASLRWRLLVNQWKRGGDFNAVIGIILLYLSLMFGVVAFAGGLAAGLMGLPRARPEHLLFVWDGIVLAFLFFWVIGLVTDLQRSDALAFDNLLHLPVSLKGTFLLNYFSSFFSVALIIFVPGIAGLICATVYVLGPGMLMLVPLAASFVLMVTAVTYQFRGWLAMLMVNRRRRRTIMAVFTFSIALMKSSG